MLKHQQNLLKHNHRFMKQYGHFKTTYIAILNVSYEYPVVMQTETEKELGKKRQTDFKQSNSVIFFLTKRAVKAVVL